MGHRRAQPLATQASPAAHPLLLATSSRLCQATSAQSMPRSNFTDPDAIPFLCVAELSCSMSHGSWGAMHITVRDFCRDAMSYACIAATQVSSGVAHVTGPRQRRAGAVQSDPGPHPPGAPSNPSFISIAGLNARIFLQHILDQGLLCCSREGPRTCMLHTCLAGCTAYSAQPARPYTQWTPCMEMRVDNEPALQVRWAKQSLERLRVGSWRGHQDGGGGGGGRLRTRQALALQREMLHTVTALHQFVCDRVVQSASAELARVSCRPSLSPVLQFGCS